MKQTSEKKPATNQLTLNQKSQNYKHQHHQPKRKKPKPLLALSYAAIPIQQRRIEQERDKFATVKSMKKFKEDKISSNSYQILHRFSSNSLSPYLLIKLFIKLFINFTKKILTTRDRYLFETLTTKP